LCVALLAGIAVGLAAAAGGTGAEAGLAAGAVEARALAQLARLGGSIRAAG
jgi:hypothetical protein